MKDTTHNNTTPLQYPVQRAKRRGGWRRVIKWTGISILSVVAFIIIAVGVATWWLTPERLTRLINREASEYLNADVEVHNARFAIWSTFPHFFISTDSIKINSRTLDSVPESVRKALPVGSGFLASVKGMKGGIDLMSLIGGRIRLNDVVVDDLRLNLVAYNDSINNFNILPTDAHAADRVPYISANSVRLSGESSLSYFSAATDTHASAQLTNVSLRAIPGHANNYLLRIPGKITATAESLRVLHNFPFELDGRVALSFRPFRFKFSDYTVDLGNTHGTLNMDMQVGGDMKINNLSYDISSFNVERLLAYLPINILPEVRNIVAELTVNASARLTSPYHFSSTTLPSLEVDFGVPRGTIWYSAAGSGRHAVTHTDALARFIFNGKNPAASIVKVLPFSLSTQGADVALSGLISRLTSQPLVDIDLKADADIGKALRPFKLLSGQRLSGKFACDTHAQFSLASFSADAIMAGLRNVVLDGDATLSNVRYSNSADNIDAYAHRVDLRFDSDANAVAASGAVNPFLKSGIKIDSVFMKKGEMMASANNIFVKANGEEKHVKSSASLLLTASNFNLIYPKDTLSLEVKNVALSGKFNPFKISALADADLKAKAENLEAFYSNANAEVKNLELDINTSELGNWHPKGLPLPAAYTSEADRQTLAFTRHTPEFVTFDAPAALLKVMNQLRLHARLRADGATFHSPAFPTRNSLGPIDVEMSFDSILIRRFSLRSRQTALRLDGEVSNLRQFIESPKPATLKVRLNVAMDTVNINQLARTYMDGVAKRHGRAATHFTAADAALAPSDTIAMLIPRNIDARIHATAMQTRYMNLHLYNLATDLNIRGGNLEVDTLNIDADFGHGGLWAAYRTSDMQRMGMLANVALTNVDVVRFFKNFHTLLLMMPQMSNLEGMLGAEMQVRMDLFPDMYINVPSLGADVELQGRGLTVHQNKFIRHLTRMMMIRNSGDLHIANMNVRASIHDNLVELYPFNFEFDNYRLRMVGTNNFDGDLYYHIGVEDWPLHIPFGINVIGEFHHPEVHFGGPDFHIRKGEEITSSVMEANSINMVRMMRKYLHEFIEKAAESADTAME